MGDTKLLPGRRDPNDWAQAEVVEKHYVEGELDDASDHESGRVQMTTLKSKGVIPQEVRA